MSALNSDTRRTLAGTGAIVSPRMRACAHSARRSAMAMAGSDPPPTAAGVFYSASFVPDSWISMSSAVCAAMSIAASRPAASSVSGTLMTNSR